MNGYLTKYLNKLKAEKKKQKQAAAFITALSLVGSGTVSWQLRGIGTAMVDDNLAESPDKNISTLSADAELCENPVMWEAALPDIRGLGISESTALIAESQLGYEKNTLNFVLDADGETHRCYTRYGDWYGNPYGEWNTMFTYFCMKYGGVDEETIPFGSCCWAWSLELEDKELLVPADRGSPSRGNAVLFDSDLDGQADRSGIVSEADMDSDEPVFRVIEGNVEGTVAEREYTPGDETIVGYLPLEVTEDTEADESEADESEAEEAAEPMEFSGVSKSGVAVRAVADEGAFPEGAVMTVTDIDRDEALKTAAESLEADKDKVDAVAVDISFSSADGSEIEPAADTTVQVQIILQDELRLSGGEYSLLHVADSGDVQKVEDAEVSQDGAEFLAGEFSTYVLTSNQRVNITNAFMLNGSRCNNSASNPYVIGIGETIKVHYDGSDYNDTNCSFTVVNNDYENNTVHRLVRDTSREVEINGEKHTYDGYDHYDLGYRTARFKGSTLSQDGDNCYIVLRKNGQDIEKLYIKVVEKPIFEATSDGKRILLDNSKTIYANKNESFKLSVNGYNNHLLAPNAGTDYDSEYITRNNTTDYTEGNTTVEFTCLKDGVTYMNVYDTQVRVVIGDLAYMKLNDGRRLPIDDALIELNGNTNKVIYAYEDEVLKFSVDGYRFHKITIEPSSGEGVLSKPYDASLGELYENGNTVVPITCKKEGIGKVKVGDTEVTIQVRHPLYVKTVIMDRDIDRVNEWLTEVYAPETNGYIANQLDGIGRFYPYYMYVGDTFEVYSDTSDMNDPKIEVEYLNMSHSWNDWYEKYTIDQSGTPADAVLKEISIPSETGRISKKYESIKTGYARVILKDGNNEVRSMYVQVLDSKDKVFDHADIEIADGGIYTLNKLIRNVDGTTEEIITQFEAYVNEVNRSVLYQENGEPTKFYEGSGAPDDTLKGEYEGVHGYENEDYWKDPNKNPGDTQYEYTSKYKKNDKGEVYKWSTKKYYAGEVDHAVFDTNLKLIPKKSKTIVYNSDGSLKSQTDYQNIENPEPKYISNVLFTMEHQDVIDAFNKCPNHSGLDFTIVASSALVEFELKKELTGGVVQDEQFTFEICDDGGNVVAQAKNNADGIVTFDNLHFEKVGEYKYTISEVKGNADNILFDKTVFNLNIKVTKDSESGTTNSTTDDSATYTNSTTSVTTEQHGTTVVTTTSGTGSSDSKEKLPQTGQLWWPVFPLVIGGLLMLILGFAIKPRKE